MLATVKPHDHPSPFFVDTYLQPSSHLSKLHVAMERYYSLGLSPAIQRSYKAGLKQYTFFCLQTHLSTIPASEHTLLLFATHLELLILTYSTIKVYMAAVRNARVTTGNHGTFDKQLTPRLNRLMRGQRGISKHSSKATSPRIRLPIIVDIMEQIKSKLKKEPKAYQQNNDVGCMLYSLLRFPPCE